MISENYNCAWNRGDVWRAKIENSLRYLILKI